MKLISCPACKREISPAAPACPGCGHPMHHTAAPSSDAGRNIVSGLGIVGKWIAIPVIAYIVFGFLAMIAFVYFITGLGR